MKDTSKVDSHGKVLLSIRSREHVKECGSHIIKTCYYKQWSRTNYTVHNLNVLGFRHSDVSRKINIRNTKKNLIKLNPSF